MSDIKWEDILRNSIIDNTIKASYLEHLPKLMTCDNWDNAIFIGRVSYQFKITNYEGALVKYDGKLYYINLKQVQAVSNFVKWNTSNIIKVINDKKKS